MGLLVVIGAQDGDDGLEGIVKGCVITFHGQLEGVLDPLGLLIVHCLLGCWVGGWRERGGVELMNGLKGMQARNDKEINGRCNINT